MVQVEFLRDLLIGEIEAHEVQAEDPDSQRLVMCLEDCSRQVVELPTTSTTLVPLAVFVSVVQATLAGRRRFAEWAAHAARPPLLSNGLKALLIIQEVLNLDQESTPRTASLGMSQAVAPSWRAILEGTSIPSLPAKVTDTTR